MSTDAYVQDLIALARAAADEIMAVYSSDFDVRRKDDASPVTEADERAEAVIVRKLAGIAADIPIVAEEAVAAGHVPTVGRRFWLVDPLDGTKEFVSRNGEFTVNVALVEDGRPVLGVVYAPALERMYYGRVGSGATLVDRGMSRRIECRDPPASGITVVSSRSHGNEDALNRFLGGRRVAASVKAGSSLKFCLVAAGEADLYPRFGRTMEWDTAAGHAVLAAAGGRVIDLDGCELLCGKPGFENPHFIAMGCVEPDA
jgi:3'(2'), 5'-bisphosphate nucleotidase